MKGVRACQWGSGAVDLRDHMGISSMDCEGTPR